MSKVDGFDGKKRWGNSGIKGVGVNSPAMMEARKGFSARHSALKKKTMAKVKVNAKDSDIGYKITDHKGTVLKHHKGAGRFEMK